VLAIRAGEVVHWRDYLDPIAVFDALGWPTLGWSALGWSARG
jgi:uncharacterized protein